MRRRDFVEWMGGGAAGLVLVGLVRPQSAVAADGKVRRIGIIVEGTRSPAYDAFLQGMDELGYVSGQDYDVDWRFADGSYLKTLNFVQDFEKRGTDVIFLGSSSLVYPARQATHTIPIVMGYAIDPIGNGFVTNLAHPGGNITGLASRGNDMTAKQLAALARVVPSAARVAYLQNPDGRDAGPDLAAMQSAAQAASLELVPMQARDANGVDAVLAILSHDKIDAIVVASDRFFETQAKHLADLALARRLPSLFPERLYVEAGGLMSFGESVREFYRRAATVVDRIFKGAKAGDLPIEQPELFEVAINRKTAEALGVEVPDKLDVASFSVVE
jgi:putative ABC transport system substrate-binding protein